MPTSALGRNFRLYLLSRFCSGAAMTMFRSTVAWHVFQLSNSAFHLGLIGLVQFIPALGLSLPAGALADTYDRQRIMLVAQSVELAVGSLLLFEVYRGGLGLELLSSSPVNSVTGFMMPNGIDGSAVIKQMRTRYGITIAGGQDHLRGKIIRIAHIGYMSEFDIITAISGLEMTLSDLGFGIRPGAGVAAAQATFAETRRA